MKQLSSLQEFPIVSFGFPPHMLESIFKILVTKTYSGEMSKVGESVAITGSMSTNDTTRGEKFDVGYFNMIDATDERMGDDKKVP